MYKELGDMYKKPRDMYKKLGDLYKKLGVMYKKLGDMYTETDYTYIYRCAFGLKLTGPPYFFKLWLEVMRLEHLSDNIAKD